MSEEPTVKPIASPKRDLEKLGKSGQAVVGELREFLSHLKGKSPKEMLGAVAESSLVRSLVSATVIMAALLFALSAIPYHLKQSEETAEAAPAKEGASQEDAAPEASKPAAGNSPDAAPPSTPEAPKTPEQRAADILGVGETADPDANPLNPLDSKDGDLLDGLDDL